MDLICDNISVYGCGIKSFRVQYNDRGAPPMSNRVQGNRIAARVHGEGREVPKMCRRTARLGRSSKENVLSPQGGGLSVYIILLSG